MLINVERHLKKFDEMAQPLIQRLSISHSQDEIERLSYQGSVVATLFRSLCEACPVENHQKHTAYFSLTPSGGNTIETCLAIRSRAKKDKYLIWLKAVSTEVGQSPQRTIKRRIPFSESLPPSKRHGGLSGLTGPTSLDQATNQIQVCPEYLAQHEEPCLLAMRMMVVSKVWHSIYFLPADERPIDECRPINLAKLLNEYKDPQMVRKCSHHGHPFLWRVRVARLITEAVLRFDCPESNYQWSKDDVIFYTLRAPNDRLEPFLKIEMESQAQEMAAINNIRGNNRQRWTSLLLNLAFVLLQLGLFQPIGEYLYRENPDMYREYIIQRVDRKVEDDQTFSDYLTVVRDCADFNVNIEGDGEETAFREEYYRRIISPLKELEQSWGSIFQMYK